MMFRATILALCLAGMPAVALADAPADAKVVKNGPGMQSVKAANDTIAGLLKQKVAPGSPDEKALAAKVTTSVRGFLDIDELGKRAMVDNWSKLTPDQQKEFLSVLRDLIESNYIKGMRSNLEYSTDYSGETTDKDGNTIVTTTIQTKRKGRPYSIEVDYVLVKGRAWDVK